MLWCRTCVKSQRGSSTGHSLLVALRPSPTKLTSVMKKFQPRVIKGCATHVVSRPAPASSDVPVRFKVGLLWTMATPGNCFCHHTGWTRCSIMRCMVRSAHINDDCCCQFSPSSQTPFIKPPCELMLSFAYSLRLLCSSWCRILHLFCLLLKVASALVAKMRNKSTSRIVSHFCVRRCLLYIREEESTRRCSSHRHFVEYLSPISKASPHALF